MRISDYKLRWDFVSGRGTVLMFTTKPMSPLVPSRFLCGGYQTIFSQMWSGWGLKSTFHLDMITRGALYCFASHNASEDWSVQAVVLHLQKSEVVHSKPFQGMELRLRLLVFLLSCVGKGLSKGNYPFQESYQIYKNSIIICIWPCIPILSQVVSWRCPEYMVIQNDCRGFNNLSYTIHLR
jgi:hypothetical protein